MPRRLSHHARAELRTSLKLSKQQLLLIVKKLNSTPLLTDEHQKFAFLRHQTCRGFKLTLFFLIKGILLRPNSRKPLFGNLIP